MADNDLMETVDSLLDSLDDVEEALEPLLSKSLQDSLASADGPIERAKVLFWLAYTIHSCTWAFTKTAGVDPDEHGVLEEMNRIKLYNGKISAAVKRAEGTSTATNPAATDPTPAEAEKRRMPLDRDAASRFIRAGIANQPSKPSNDSTFYTAQATVNDPLAGPGPHSRLSSLARASTSQPTTGTEAAESSSSDSEEDLQVYASTVASTSAAPVDAAKESKASTPQVESTEQVGTQADEDKKKKRQEKKRKRLLGVTADPAPSPKVLQDPLSGYDNNAADSKKAKKTKQPKSIAESKSQDTSRASSVAASQIDSSAGPAGVDGEKKKKKRKKNQQEA